MIWVVGFGGILGAICRYLLALTLNDKMNGFPLATWIVNISGTFLLGCIYAYYLNHGITEALWLFIGIGFLGSYTTMSTFGYEVVQMLEKRKLKQAIFYVITSLMISLLFAWIGWKVITYIHY